jgi:hypothetical protein
MFTLHLALSLSACTPDEEGVLAEPLLAIASLDERAKKPTDAGGGKGGGKGGGGGSGGTRGGGKGGKGGGSTDTGGADTGGADTGGADTGGADTGIADTGIADTGIADTGGADTGIADTGAGAGGASDVADIAWCDDVSVWDDGWTAFEEEVVELVNAYRAEGADCGTYGVFGPADPLTMEPRLRCAARAHSADMRDQDYFSHTSPTGETMANRLSAVGYPYFTAGENIGAGYSTPASVVAAWVASDGHCRNLMDPAYSDIGVGYADGGGSYGSYWTQDFGQEVFIE